MISFTIIDLFLLEKNISPLRIVLFASIQIYDRFSCLLACMSRLNILLFCKDDFQFVSSGYG